MVSKPLGNRRVTGTEQFYTPLSLAQELVDFSQDFIPDFRKRSFLEPAGGNGSFLTALKKAGVGNVISVDLYPKHKSVVKKDFLKFKPSQERLVTISNPPFGRNNALSIPFFNHAAEFSDFIAFLIPRSWRKWSVQNRLNLNFHKIADRDVFVSYEDELGNPIREKNGLRTCFQIWRKEPTPRTKTLIPNNGLIEKCSPGSADIAIRVFGYGCGKVLTDFPRKPNTTLMFLKVKDKKTATLLTTLDYQRFSTNTAYTEALAFTELNFLLNEAVFGNGHYQAKVDK